MQGNSLWLEDASITLPKIFLLFVLVFIGCCRYLTKAWTQYYSCRFGIWWSFHGVCRAFQTKQGDKELSWFRQQTVTYTTWSQQYLLLDTRMNCILRNVPSVGCRCPLVKQRILSMNWCCQTTGFSILANCVKPSRSCRCISSFIV